MNTDDAIESHFARLSRESRFLAVMERSLGTTQRASRPVTSAAPPPLKRLRRSAARSKDVENIDAAQLVQEVCQACLRERQSECDADMNELDESALHENVDMAACFTDAARLNAFVPLLHYVPRIVNIVTLAEMQPCDGGDTTLPLDLHSIASKCTNAYYAPNRFSAVQLAYAEPRSRILVFRAPASTPRLAAQAFATCCAAVWHSRLRRASQTRVALWARAPRTL